MAFFSTRTGQFTYFALQVGDPIWSGKNVLDFGGNIGNILQDPNSNIDHERYWCLDVVNEAVEKGKIAYPKSHWLFYNRYSFSFNPHGVRYLPVPDLGQTFDYIVAFSVFTNTTVTDMLQMVDQLESLLSPGGALAFTFLDPYYFASPKQSNFQWRLELELERKHITTSQMKDIAERSANADWFMLVNWTDLYVETEDIHRYKPEEEQTCYVYHTEAYMRSLFPKATILPPVSNEMHHCCVIRKS